LQLDGNERPGHRVRIATDVAVSQVPH